MKGIAMVDMQNQSLSVGDRCIYQTNGKEYNDKEYHAGKITELKDNNVWFGDVCVSAEYVMRQTIDGNTNDGYHSFNELYHHRAVLFSVICHDHRELAWKSKRHHNDEDHMYGGMFIVGIDTPAGQATYHYDIIPYWDMFDVQELECAPKWDGHTSDEAIKRIESLKEI